MNCTHSCSDPALCYFAALQLQQGLECVALIIKLKLVKAACQQVHMLLSSCLKKGYERVPAQDVDVESVLRSECC